MAEAAQTAIVKPALEVVSIKEPSVAPPMVDWNLNLASWERGLCPLTPQKPCTKTSFEARGEVVGQDERFLGKRKITKEKKGHPVGVSDGPRND